MPKLYVFELSEITQSDASDGYAIGVTIDTFPEPCAVIHGGSYAECMRLFEKDYDINDYCASWNNGGRD